MEKSGATTGFTKNGVLKKVLMMHTFQGCGEQPNQDGGCTAVGITLTNIEQINGNGFSAGGDSGALVMTKGTCEPEPVGMIEGVDPGVTYAQNLDQVLNELGQVSGDTFTFFGSGVCGCALSLPGPRRLFGLLRISYNDDGFGAFLQNVQNTGNNMGYVINTVTGVESIEDLSIPDPDVVTAYAARTDFLANETPCETVQVPNNNFGTSSRVENVGIDLSGAVAALDIQVPTAANLDPTNVCIPATFEGVPVEQEVLQTSPLS